MRIRILKMDLFFGQKSCLTLDNNMDRLIQQTARVEAEHRKSPCETSATSPTPLILGLKSDAGAIRKRLVGWSVAKVDWKSLLEHVFQFEIFEWY